MVGHIVSRKEKESLGAGLLGCEETKEKKRGMAPGSSMAYTQPEMDPIGSNVNEYY
jgi:hypothetical protein